MKYQQLKSGRTISDRSTEASKTESTQDCAKTWVCSIYHQPGGPENSLSRCREVSSSSRQWNGKRSIEERPKHIETRRQLGHWEVDTVHGSGRHSVVTLVQRMSGYVEIGKISAVTIEETNRAMIGLIGRHYHSYKSITADDSGEFHGYRKIETFTDIAFYFCHPHHSWERGTNENTNGLIRQYLPKGIDLTSLTQERCDEIAEILNSRPRKRLQFKTPLEVFLSATVALHS